jgi:hypothetical protein
MTTTPRDDDILVGRSYTRSRQFPVMFGRLPGHDGARLPGGPYTVTQAVLFLILLLAVWKVAVLDVFGPLRWLLPFAAAFVRQARIESRSPMAWVMGVAAHLASSPTGRIARRPYRATNPTPVAGRLFIHHPASVTAAAPAPARAAAAETNRALRPMPPARPASSQPAVAVPLAAAVASPLQQLLDRTADHAEVA